VWRNLWGLAFMGGYVGCGVLFVAGAVQFTTNNFRYYRNSGYSRNSGVWVMLMGLGGMASI